MRVYNSLVARVLRKPDFSNWRIGPMREADLDVEARAEPERRSWRRVADGVVEFKQLIGTTANLCLRTL